MRGQSWNEHARSLLIPAGRAYRRISRRGSRGREEHAGSLSSRHVLRRVHGGRCDGVGGYRETVRPQGYSEEGLRGFSVRIRL